MMTLTPRAEGIQQFLPGIDPDPMPTTLEQSERFLRRYVNTTTHWHEDHDLLKIKITCDNLDGDKGSYTDEAELPLNDPRERERKIIALAQQAHAFKKKRELGEI